MNAKGVLYVAVLVDTTDGWGRSLVRGIGNFARTCGSWRIWIEAWGRGAPIPLSAKWRGDGVIAGLYNSAISDALATIKAPMVNISAIKLQGVNLPRVTTNMHAAARLAVNHLLDRGLRHFAYYGRPSNMYIQDYRQEFVDALGEAGYDCRVFGSSKKEGFPVDLANDRRVLASWLKTLPKPVGVLTWPTQYGRRVIYASKSVNLAVPEQVAVLAGDEDDVLCDVCYPSLSGVALNSERIGYEAAALLDRLMRRERPPKSPILIDPTGVVTRQSTDTLAIDDAAVAQAIAFIRHHDTDPINVEDVLRAVPLSRRRLELRFRRVLGRTLAAEILRVHLERAKQLLTETNLAIPAIAATSGFGSPEYFARVFKRDIGLTPHKYRVKIHGQ